MEFLYKGVDQEGEPVSGTIEAADKRGAVADLAVNGQFATELFEKSDAGRAMTSSVNALGAGRTAILRSAKVRSKDVLAMTSQLSTALRAGLPILNALEIIAAQQHKQGMKQLLENLAKAVSSGQSLSDAMEERSDAFSPLYVSMVRVGETGGILEDTIYQLSQLLERDEKVKSEMKNAAAYPVFVLAVGIASAVLMMTKILPKIIATIGGGAAILPLPTRMLMSIGGFLTHFGWLLALVIAGGGYYFYRWKKTAPGRLKWDSFKLRVPILGSVLLTIAVSRFARTLGALTKSGITILGALAVVRDTLGNELLGRAIDDVAADVKAGQPLAEPLSSSGLFPPLLVQIVSIGEQTGQLDTLLLNAADTFDSQADAAIKRFMAVFPALLILMLALIIGFIIAATLLPIVAMELGGGIH